MINLVENRIKLDDSFRVGLFQNILDNEEISLFELSKKLGCGYSAIKNWNAGARLIPESIFNKLLDMSNQDTRGVASKKSSIYPNNWGQRLGGIESYKKYKKQINLKMAHARSFIHTIDIPKVDSDIWELVGACLGDGCLSKYFSKYESRWLYQITFTGNMNDDRAYYLNRIIPILKSKFSLTGYYYIRPEYHVICIPIKSKRIFDFLNDLGMPIGDKKNKLRITDVMFNSSKAVKAAILRGLLDTDGCIYARKDENYRYLEVKITSGSKLFLYDIKSVLQEFGLPAYVHWQEKRDAGDVVLRGNNNIERWMAQIGTSHPLIKERYNEWIETGRLLPKNHIKVGS